MYRITFLAMLMCAALLGKELWRMEFPNAASADKVLIWQGNNAKVQRSYAAGVTPDSSLKGSVRFEVESSGTHPAHSTPVLVAPVNIVSGQKYQVRFRVMSPQKLTFQVLTMMDAPPWQRLGKKSSVYVNTQPNEWQSYTIDFEATCDVSRSRTLAFFVGVLKKGDVFYLSDVQLHGPEKVNYPLFNTVAEPMLTDIAKKRDWSYASAWKEVRGERLKVSLCGLWDFAPATEAGSAIPADGAPDWCHMLVPAHWRGGNITNFIHTKDGKVLTAYRGIPVRELRNGWYKRTIDIPKEWSGRKVLLQFNRLDITGDIFVNGKRVGGSENFTVTRECSLDVSAALEYGKVNQISVRVGTPGELRQERSGIAGYVYLMVSPKEHFGQAYVNTHVSAGKMTLAFREPTVNSGTLHLTIRDWKSNEKVYSKSLPYAKKVTLDYLPPKLWSPEAPNLYWMDLSLERDGKVLDADRIRFGACEVVVKGADYYLNGKKINIFADTAYDSGTYWSIDWKNANDFIRRQLQTMRRMNINATYFGDFMPKELLDVYDEEGILILASVGITYKEHSTYTDEQAYAVFQRKIDDILAKDRFDNHPSHMGFLVDVWYNFHPGTTNPEYVGLKDGVKSYPAFDEDGKVITKQAGDPNLIGERGRRKARLDHIANMFKQAFPGKLMLTGGSGEVGDVYATHGYHTWGAPFEEMRAFFRRYSLQRERPVFVGEHNIPYPGSLYSIFNFSAAGADPLAMENFARYSGNDGYRWRIFYGRRALHDMGPSSIQDSRTDRDGNIVTNICSDLYSAILSRSLETMIPGWRASGANGVGFFGYVLGQHFVLAGHSVPRYRPVPNELSTPTFHPEYMPGGASPAGFPEPHRPYFLKPTLSTSSFLRVSAPVLVEFMEDDDDEYSQDHSYFSGEKLEKKLLVVNDSDQDREFTGRITLRNSRNGVVQSQDFQVKLKQGQRTYVPVEMKMPNCSGRLDMVLRAEVWDAISRHQATLPVEIFAAPGKLQQETPIYLFDPEGSVKAYLKKTKSDFKEVKSLKKLPSKGVLVIGRQALTMSADVPNFNALAESGLNCLILEQAISASLELMRTRTRQAFINAAGHPALQGFTDRDFDRWRGCYSLVNSYEVNPAGSGWSAAGNRNMVASYVFRRPSHGNYLSLLTSGFDMYQTPLLEYRSRKGSWIGSQLEMGVRLGIDPVATTLFHRMVDYLASRGTSEGKTLYFGGSAGKKLLKRLRVVYEDCEKLDAATLATADTLLISDPDFQALTLASMQLNDFVYNGGKVLYLHTGNEFKSMWLPFPLKLTTVEARQALRKVDRPDDFWRCGWDNNDLYWHEQYHVQAFTEIPEQANAFDPGVVVDLPHGNGRYTLVSIQPADFKNHTATGKTCRFLSALLSNAGVVLKNDSTAYLPRKGVVSSALNLDKYDWSFALDPDNKGMKEGVHTGKDGSLFWQTGLIADGAEVKIGIPFEHFLRRDYDGYAWYRLDLELPKEMHKVDKLYLSFRCIDDFDETFFNGVKVGSTGRETSNWWVAPRLYIIPGKLIKPGKNQIIVRVFDEKGEGGINRLPVVLSNQPAGEGERGWKTPYQEGTLRDYDYKSDPVRQY